MWTVCWTTKEGEDKWDRIEDKDAMELLVDAIVEENSYNGYQMRENILVFPPDSEWELS